MSKALLRKFQMLKTKLHAYIFKIYKMGNKKGLGQSLKLQLSKKSKDTSSKEEESSLKKNVKKQSVIKKT